MHAATELKALLLEELELITRTTANLLRKIRPEDRAYRPVETMRSLQELVHHLVSVPAVDLLILQEKSEQEIRRLEAAIAADAEADKLIEWMNSGLRDLRSYMELLTEEQFLRMATKPFYLEHSSVQAKWLVEIVTHAQHHRAQLFTYLKILGYEVNMFDLYAQ